MTPVVAIMTMKLLLLASLSSTAFAVNPNAYTSAWPSNDGWGWGWVWGPHGTISGAGTSLSASGSAVSMPRSLLLVRRCYGSHCLVDLPCPNDNCVFVLHLHAGNEHSLRHGHSFASEVYRICSSVCRGFYSVTYISDIHHVSRVLLAPTRRIPDLIPTDTLTRLLQLLHQTLLPTASQLIWRCGMEQHILTPTYHTQRPSHQHQWRQAS
jgi:hypothetical protein